MPHRLFRLSGLALAAGVLSACGQPGEDAALIPDTPPPETGVIEIADVQMGDIACYFVLDSGEIQPAEFSLCDPALAGTRHTATYGEVAVQSPACEGDPDCALTVTETLVVDLAPVIED